jgi:hypothetical protein
MLRVLSLLSLAALPIFAADIEGKYEVSAFGGTANRITSSSGADGNFGANFSVGGKTMLFGEVTSNVGGFDYLDVHAGLKRDLIRRGRFEPYVLGGVGAARTSARNSTSLSLNAGFGARFYIGQHWGVQPEFRWLHFFGNNDVNLLRTTGGIFFQWGEE